MTAPCAVYFGMLAALNAATFEGAPVELPKGVAIVITEDVLRSSREWSEKRDDPMACSSTTAGRPGTAESPPQGSRSAVLALHFTVPGPLTFSWAYRQFCHASEP